MKLPSLFFLTFFHSLHTISLLVLSATTLPLHLRSLLTIKSSIQDPHDTFYDWDWPPPSLSKPGLQDPVWCSWSGIKCNPRTAQITSLNLSRRNLSGVIPAEIRYLSSLIHLNLSGNAFEGPLQPAIFELTELKTLDISHNNFNLTFPPGISKLKFLRILDAYSNSFTGRLPEELILLPFLEKLNLGGSYFDGDIPTSYGSFPRLKSLYLAGNKLEGQLPPQLGFLSQLERMEIGYNMLSGRVPEEFALLTNLQYLDISKCNLSGNLTQELGNLTKLESLLLFTNQLTGEIPVSFTNLKALKVLDLSFNRLSGTIPEGLASLKELTRLSLMTNELTGEIPLGIGELPNLDTLSLWANKLTGTIPQKLGSNNKLEWLDVSSNSLTGPIPPSLCQGNKLFKLILFSNNFVDRIPSSLANCTSLTRFRTQNNQLNGTILKGLGLLPNLTYVDLSTNNLTGEIPLDLGNARQLQYLNISGNSFDSDLPWGIWRAPNLQIFSACSSKIVGKVPNFTGCSSVYKIELQGNSLNGSIPSDIDHCDKLLYLNLSRNSLNGIIPWEISKLPAISFVDLSHNSLTGTIPSNFENCSTLECFDVSYNLLTGPIPDSGSIFPNLHPSSFSGNEGLCGGAIAKPCAADAPSVDDVDVSRRQHPKKTAGAIVWIIAVAFGIGLIVLVAGTRCFHSNYNRKFSDDREIGPWKLTSFQRLNFTADDVLECLAMTDKIIGMGSTGTVYKAEMPGGEIIAVKKLWGKPKENIRRRRGVLAEVDVLGNVRHRNIVRLLGCCSNREWTMLLYEYMPNGNLDDLLHGKNKGENLVADWLTRYKIALGVAQGICYLHHDCDPVIVHRDLKPSNILLDAEMEARVADFGVAKLIQSDESMSVIAGSYGYIAPEYAYTLQVDEKSDIYSFGVVLMEIIRKRLPYPSRSFELAHCSRCRIDWLQRDGILLLELDRVLRPGGYFAYSSPEAYANDPENRRIGNAMNDLLKRMCWRVVVKRDQSVIWAKPMTNSCYLKREHGTRPPLCSADDDPDATWNVHMKACISLYPAKMHREKGSGLIPWPQRLTAAPPRLEDIGVTPEEFHEDTKIWQFRVSEYWKQMKSIVQKKYFRNVMDMNSNLGGFAAALKDTDVWVMNVAPVNKSARLKIIYDRGLIGTVHDWCESFSTYPRTYDLLHAWNVFSEIEERQCGLEDALIEIDRILRPEGFVIIRDKFSITDRIRKLIPALRWDRWLSEVEPRSDALSSGKEWVLIVRKKLWS